MEKYRSVGLVLFTSFRQCTEQTHRTLTVVGMLILHGVLVARRIGRVGKLALRSERCGPAFKKSRKSCLMHCFVLSRTKPSQESWSSFPIAGKMPQSCQQA
jgi:hypothetical protein